ncbi:stage III sporulation protein AF [Marininema halotolerans]|uniref:Stage III sporulation protein AF n=1 Tax=Marininema halotolerans TaxID=1155944 RepID=A0A1I6TVL0_9BACL|nr:stage III sporulation protein AF [Marininema halotolerans]SFS93279.1 stage III sporulation protein AF [Marininema halotolerans]
MIELVADWLKPIIILVLLATFMDLLLPHNGMERYVKLVMGLLIIMAILSPILQFLQKDIQLSDIAWDSQINGQGEASLTSIQQEGKRMGKKQEKMIQSEVEKKMALAIQQDVEKRFKVEVTTVTAQTTTHAKKEPSVHKLSLRYQKQKEPNTSQQVDPVDEVKPVHVELSDHDSRNESKPKISTKTDALGRRIRQYLSETWGIPPDAITIKQEPEA